MAKNLSITYYAFNSGAYKISHEVLCPRRSLNQRVGSQKKSDDKLSIDEGFVLIYIPKFTFRSFSNDIQG